MEPSLNGAAPPLSLPWRKVAPPGAPQCAASLRWRKTMLPALLLAVWPPAPAAPREPPAPPGLVEVAQAYRRHVEESNAALIETLGPARAREQMVRIVELEAVRCEYHSGRSHVCRIVVVTEVNGRVGQRRGGDILMIPDGEDGWRVRLVRRPR